MVLYNHTNVTAKNGINFVRSAVEGAGSLFHKIEAENDLGIDGLIALVRDEKPLNRQVAVQVKSGPSYYNALGEECLIPIESHRDYWLNHPLPVVEIVFVPSLGVAHWVNIKGYLKEYPTNTVICFHTSEANRFDRTTFSKLFVPTVLREVPDLSLAEALNLFDFSKPDESYLGLIVLFRRYPNAREVWNRLVQRLVERPVPEIPPVLVYFLAHIPWHGDIAYFGEPITKETKAHATELLVRLSREQVVKLLGFVDEETSISRGAIGQSVEAIISSLPNATEFLTDIALDNSLSVFRRECAAIILAMNEGKSTIPTLTQLADTGSWYAGELIEHLSTYGGINPYA
jgi:Domain of unknown function (DUF4365)